MLWQTMPSTLAAFFAWIILGLGRNILIQDQTVLEIRTLGNFQVSYGEKILTQEYSRSYRLWKIFKYLITYREQGVLPEVLVENLAR